MDEETKKHLLRDLPYGLFAACTKSPEGEDHVFLLSWVTQASFEPPLLACCVHAESQAHDHLAEEGRPIAINLLADDQEELARTLLEGPAFEDDEVADTPYKEGANGCALLPETMGAIEARVVSVTEGGDHDILLVEIEDVHRFREGEILTHESSGMTYAG
jgi:flavin reductase (DIM6/NTAB) family NADH-FMN oxidoreductase RutF